MDYVNDLRRSNKFLLLSGFGIFLGVDFGKLVVKNGDGQKQVFYPKRFPYDNVVIDGARGSISFDAIRWLIRHDVQVSILNWDGKLLSSILSNETKQVDLKFKQYKTFESPRRLLIAKNLIKAKVQKSKEVLCWLKERYHEIDFDLENEVVRLDEVRSVSELLMVEGRIASIYWGQLSKIFPKKYHFLTRQYINRPMGSVDEINTLFNYGYSLLEGECRRAINTVGLDTHVGFCHLFHVGKQSLVYDCQEPFRFLIDLAIINSLENKVFEKKDFIRTENYNIKLRKTGAQKLVKEVQGQFNKKTSYLGREYTWSFVILLKVRELAQFITGQRDSLDFSKPSLQLNRNDKSELRERIRSMTYSEARKLGIGKSSLFYLKHHNDKPFKVYKKMQDKLNGEFDE